MSTGTVKFFNSAKGFGFVTPDGGGVDIFLPAAAVSAAGVATVKPGQRIAFEQAPDTKGPKIVSLNLVGEPPAKAPAPAPVPTPAPVARVTVYGDAGADITADVVEAVQASNFTLSLQDLVTQPPPADQLKRLSQMLSACGQSLVRRYDPLFFALQLDDRFITDQDFWTAIVEHPALINGPVVVASGRARICKTEDDVLAFLRNDEVAAAPKPKTLSPRIAAMLNGEAVPQAEPVAAVEPPPPTPIKPAPEPAAKPVIKLQIRARPIAEPKAPATQAEQMPAKKTVAEKPAPQKVAAKKPAAAKKAAPVKSTVKKAAPKKAVAKPAKKAKKRA